jgi:hypothetical protein
MIVEGRIRIPYRWPAGRVGGRYLEELRKGRIVGLRCPDCRTVTVPPRPRCLACRSTSDDWVPVGPGGTVMTWTRDLALIRLDGADTSILHRVLGSVGEGTRVTAVFDEHGLAGFRP